MTWEEILKDYRSNNDAWYDSLIHYLKSNYIPPKKRQTGYILNDNKLTVSHNGIDTKLEPKTFKMLHYIYLRKPQIVSREEIYKKVWGDVIVEERTIDVHVRKIRKAIPGIPLKTQKKSGLYWDE